MQKFNIIIKVTSERVDMCIYDMRHIHALFFQMLKTAAPELAAQVHATQNKPFALWLSHQCGNEIQVIVSIFSQEVCDAFQKLISQCPMEYQLNKKKVYVTIKAEQPQQYVSLWERARNQEYSKLKIEFLSPTSFRRDGVQILFPEPALLFQNVYTKAIANGGQYLADNLSAPSEFTPYLYISRYNLVTEEVNYGNYKIIGCKGLAIYDCRQIRQPYLKQSLIFLSTLAEYTGIGYKTTMGLGRVKCELI